MVSEFFNFSLTVIQHIVAQNQTGISQLPEWQNTARKSLFDVIFTDFYLKKTFLGNYTVNLKIWFFAKTCPMTVKENSQNLGTPPLVIQKIPQKNTE